MDKEIKTKNNENRVDSLGREIKKRENKSAIEKPNISKLKIDFEDVEKGYKYLYNKYSKYFDSKIEEYFNNLDTNIFEAKDTDIEIMLKDLLCDTGYSFKVQLSNYCGQTYTVGANLLTNTDTKKVLLSKEINLYNVEISGYNDVVSDIYIPIPKKNISYKIKTGSRKYIYHLRNSLESKPNNNKILKLSDFMAFIWTTDIAYQKLNSIFDKTSCEEIKGIYTRLNYISKSDLTELWDFYEPKKIGYHNIQNSAIVLEAFGIIQEELYSEELDRKYTDNLKSDYAKSFEEKKNIPEKIKVVMNKNKFLSDFKEVELDQEIDLIKFHQIEEEYFKLKQNIKLDLLFSSEIKPDLRFRKLGQHKALGLYFPFYNCICIDMKSPASFMHELGHCIDYTFEKQSRLSAKFNFNYIVNIYRHNFESELEEMKSSDIYVYLKNKKNYFFNRTEIFARSFEIYLLKTKKLDSSFLKNELKLVNGYPKITKTFLDNITKYFDELLSKINLDFPENLSTLLSDKEIEDIKNITDSSNKVNVKCENKNFSINTPSDNIDSNKKEKHNHKMNVNEKEKFNNDKINKEDSEFILTVVNNKKNRNQYSFFNLM